jgi:flagellar biosynthesis protein FlhG
MNSSYDPIRIRTGMKIPRLIAVASGKGGVGKSIIAYNLADLLAQRSRVLLVDADFTMGNLHLLANVAPVCGWQSCCGGGVDIADAMTPISANLNLLASSSGRQDRLFPEMHELTAFLEALHRNTDYDTIIIDTASGILPHTNLTLGAADEVILVTTPELTAISDAYALYKVLISNDRETKASLLVNRQNSAEDAEYIYRKFVTVTDQFLGRAPGFLGRLADDPTVTESVARQRALSAFNPESEIIGQFALLIESLFDRRRAVNRVEETTNLNPVGADIRE